MLRGLYLLTIIFIGCVSNRDRTLHTEKSMAIDFKDCGENLSYSSVRLIVPKGFKLTKVRDDFGFCEYQFAFTDNTILYLSSNSYSGSKLNYQNRFNAGVESYSNNRTEYDSIVIGGKQSNGRYWKEMILHDLTIGYINAVDVEILEQTIKSVSLVQ